MPATAASRTMRATDVAPQLGKSPKTIREYARRGLLPAMRVGPRGHYSFDPKAIESLLASASWGREVDPRDEAGTAAPAARRGPTSTGDDP